MSILRMSKLGLRVLVLIALFTMLFWTNNATQVNAECSYSGCMTQGYNHCYGAGGGDYWTFKCVEAVDEYCYVNCDNP